MSFPSPSYNAVKGTTSGTPGTGAFTPNAASSGYRAWSNVPAGWVGLVRYEDGSNWELTWSYWNGTTLSRASTQLFDSSSGSAISLTSSATAALIVEASDVNSATNGIHGAFAFANNSSSSNVGIGMGATGTPAAATIAATNYLTTQHRIAVTSATTANAQSGYTPTFTPYAVTSTTAGMGGYEYLAKFGFTQLPTGPRFFGGMVATTSMAGNTNDPSIITTAYAGFAFDSTDTNFQLLVNSGGNTGTKTDTGIAYAVNGWYECRVWNDPGSTTVRGLLIRRDTGAVWYGATSTDVPGDGTLLCPQIYAGLSSTTGTAIILQFGGMSVRQPL